MGIMKNGIMKGGDEIFILGERQKSEDAKVHKPPAEFTLESFLRA